MYQIETIKKIISMVTKCESLEPNDVLKEKGVSSLNMMTILTNIESAFDIEIPDEKLVLSNFETINSIDKLVTELVNE